MSAFLVSDNHLHAICSFAGKLKFYHLPEHGQLFVDLKGANLLALRDRYGDPVEKVEKPQPKKIDVSPVAMLKAVQCLDYQCSDWAGWGGSLAKKYLDKIVSAAIMELPGYQEAKWGIE